MGRTSKSIHINRSPSTAEAAYTAGIIDGEGSISLNPTNSKGLIGACGRPTQSPRALIQVSMTHLPTIEWLQKTWEIGPICVRYRPTRPEHKTTYRWHIAGTICQPFLESIYPYLITKRRQAQLAIEWCQRPRHHSAKIGEDEMKRRFAMRHIILSLNRSHHRTKNFAPWERSVRNLATHYHMWQHAT